MPLAELGPLERAPARTAGAAARADRVRHPTRARRAAAAARGRPATRAARCRDWRARPTSRPSRRRCSPGASAPAPVSGEVGRSAAPVVAGAGRGRGRLLLDGLVTRYTEGYAASVAPLSQALRAFRGSRRRERGRALALAGVPSRAGPLGRRALARGRDRGVQLARDTGALQLLPTRSTISPRSTSLRRLRHRRRADRRGRCAHAGDRAPATQVRESESWPRHSGDRRRAVRCSRDATECTRRAVKARRSACTGASRAWRAQRHGQYGNALVAARQACEHEEVMVYGGRPRRADRSRRPRRTAGRGRGRARPTAANAHRRAAPSGRSASRRAVAHSARRRGPTRSRSSGSRAAAPRSSSRAAGSCTGSGSGARTGARDARELLRAAHESFSHMGAVAFAERARRELLATGETARRITADTRDALTPQEIQVARLARDGLHQSGDRRPALHQRRARSSTTCTRCSASSRSTTARSSATRSDDSSTGGRGLRVADSRGTRAASAMNPSHGTDLQGRCDLLRSLHRRATRCSSRMSGTSRPREPSWRPDFPWSRRPAAAWPPRSATRTTRARRPTEMLAAAARIARGVDVPVTVDAEAGYGMEPAELVAALRSVGRGRLQPRGHRPRGRSAPRSVTARRVAAGGAAGRVGRRLPAGDQRAGRRLPRSYFAGAGPGTQIELVPEALRARERLPRGRRRLRVPDRAVGAGRAAPVHVRGPAR